jgi:tRNA dimethylallyltransferase
MTSDCADRLLVVVGPTASGKTELAVNLAELLDAEVVSADSVQVYRAFDIGSGKPTPDERQRARHHLIDIVDPLEPLDAAAWARRADRVITEIRGRGKLAIVCGGTFLWIKALLYGLAPASPANDAIREQHRRLVERAGRAQLHQQLLQVDPTSAQRLAPNDFVRVSRALEVFELSGVPLSRWQQDHGFRSPRYAARLMGIAWPREQLDWRISRRTRSMLNAGWVEEVRQLLSGGYQRARAMRSVGYRQISGALLAGGTEPDADALHEAIYRATRRFARRQRTWLRDQPVEWLTPEQTQDLHLDAWS